MITLGKTIRYLRLEKGWNQEEMANRLYISIPAYSKIETGVTDISVSRLEQIANLFGLTPIQLISYSFDEPSNEEANQLAIYNKRIMDREAQIIELQKKIIELFEETRDDKGIPHIINHKNN